MHRPSVRPSVRLLVICLLGVSAAEARAQAGWSGIDITPAGDVPLGAAIRNWGPTRDVFIAREWHTSAGTNELDLSWFECEYPVFDGHLNPVPNPNPDVCTWEQQAPAPGEPVGPVHLTSVGNQESTQPSMGIRRRPALDAIELVVTYRDHWAGPPSTCDGSPGVSSSEEQVMDLLAARWTEGVGLWGTSVIAPASGAPCVDHVRNFARFGHGVAWACYTSNEWGGGEDVRCNYGPAVAAPGGPPTWPNELRLPTTGAPGGEDHPSFDFYGADQRLVVTSTERSGADGIAARVHVRHGPVPADEARVEFPRKSPSSKVDFTDIAVSNGRMHMVWRDGDEGLAEIKYAECPFDLPSGVDCSNRLLHWDEEVITDAHFDADTPELAIDGDKQFVLFHYNSSEHLDAYRVVVGERCRGDDWTFDEDVRAPDLPSEDQHNKWGRPSIVLDRQRNIVHIVFAEVMEFDGTWDPGNNGELYWYRRPYVDCAGEGE